MARVGETEPPCRKAASRVLRIVPAFIRRLRPPKLELCWASGLGWFLGGLLAHGGPDEASEFPCDGDDDLGARLSSLEHSGEAAVEALHRLVCDGDDARGLALSSLCQAESAGAMAVVPGGLDEQPSHVTVAGLGDFSSMLFASGGVLAGDESEEAMRPRAESKRMKSCSSATRHMAVSVSMPRKQRNAPTTLAYRGSWLTCSIWASRPRSRSSRFSTARR